MTEDLDSIAEMAITEMSARLKDHPKDITDGVLVRLATEANKIIDRREKEKEVDETEARPFVLMDELSALPRERARVLVKEEIGRLRAELVHYEQWLQDSPPAS